MSAADAVPAPRASGDDIQLSLLVTCFNSAPRLARFLPGIAASLASLDVRSELVVVDNGSTDDTAAVARAIVPTARVVTVMPNRGSAGGRNAGARATRGEWLLLCDDDVELTASCLRALWDARTPPDCVVPLLRDLQGVLQNSVTAAWRRGDLKLVHHQEPIPTVAYPVTACLILHRELFWAAGGFDERYQPNCYEDVAFGFALRQVGADTVLLPTATVTHHVHGGEAGPLNVRSVSAHANEYRQRIYKNRWLFDLLVLRGRQRWTAVSLGLPRTVLESCRVRSPGPVLGYWQGWQAYLRDRFVRCAPPARHGARQDHGVV